MGPACRSWSRSLSHCIAQHGQFSLGRDHSPSEALLALLCSLAVIQHLPGPTGRSKGFILAYSLQSITERSQGRNLELGSEAEFMKDQFVFLYSVGHLPRGNDAHSRWGPRTSAFIERMSHRPVWCRQILSRNLPFPGDSSVCHADQNRPSQVSNFCAHLLSCRKPQEALFRLRKR